MLGPVHIAYAAESFDDFLVKVTDQLINPLIGFLFALAVIFFLYGVLEFLLRQESEEAKTTGKQHMIWGIIGITIMMGVWTILAVISNTIGTSGDIELNPAKVQFER